MGGGYKIHLNDSFANGTMDLEEITAGDAAWILSNAFLILTMQSGFGLLEAGFVSTKNMANIMVKNVVDVCLGGIAYWSFGYGFSFGQPSNWFCGFGDFFATESDTRKMGTFYTRYVFQFTFATASTTIVSGAIAERMKLSAYVMFSVLNTLVYVFPASWAWHDNGFLRTLGFHDFAGACIVHLTGGASALVAAKMLGPRLGKYKTGGGEMTYPMSSAVTALTGSGSGTFMLWWAWLAFNCGSTFGIENYKWKVAARAGINTLNGSIGGGIAGIAFSLIISKGQLYDIGIMICGVLGGLVGVTAGCAVFQPFDSIVVGALGGLFANIVNPLVDYFHVDDPVGAVGVHLGSAFLGTVFVGLLGHNDFNLLGGNTGLLYGGGFQQLLIQCFGIIVVGSWSMALTYVSFTIIRHTVGLRVTEEHELLGADRVEHLIHHTTFAQKLESAFMRITSQKDDDDVDKMLQTLIVQLLEMANKEEHGFRVTMHPAEATIDRRMTLQSISEAMKFAAAATTQQSDSTNKTQFSGFFRPKKPPAQNRQHTDARKAQTIAVKPANGSDTTQKSSKMYAGTEDSRTQTPASNDNRGFCFLNDASQGMRIGNGSVKH